MNLNKFLVVLFNALIIYKYVDIIYKACYVYIKLKTLIAFKKIYIIK
jgi:hypothetical protein